MVKSGELEICHRTSTTNHPRPGPCSGSERRSRFLTIFGVGTSERQESHPGYCASADACLKLAAASARAQNRLASSSGQQPTWAASGAEPTAGRAVSATAFLSSRVTAAPNTPGLPRAYFGFDFCRTGREPDPTGHDSDRQEALPAPNPSRPGAGPTQPSTTPRATVGKNRRRCSVRFDKPSSNWTCGNSCLQVYSRPGG